MEIYYAGIGSRETPEDVCRKMHAAAKSMARLGFILRSGGASGADSAFESGVAAAIAESNGDLQAPASEIYLPWKGFRQNQSPLYGSTREARLIARDFHPKWEILSCAGRDFHARNVYQIRGSDLQTFSSFVLCWTNGGKITGGTGQALRMAQAYDIPILNFATDDDEYISDFILETAKRNRA